MRLGKQEDERHGDEPARELEHREGSGTRQDPDESLVQAVRAGDDQAFRALFERHAERMMRLALRILRHRADAEDAVQEAFLALHRSLTSDGPGGFRAQARFGTWFHRVVVNACLKRRERAPGLREEPLESEPAEPERRDALEGDALCLLDRELDALPLQQRLVFQLTVVEGHAPKEVAAMLDLNPGTVRHHLFQARARLRARLGPLLHDTARAAGEVPAATEATPAKR